MARKYSPHEIIAFLSVGCGWGTPEIHEFIIALEQFWNDADRQEEVNRKFLKGNRLPIPEED